MRILYYGESPCIQTGLGQVSAHHLSMLLRMGHEIEVVGLNHFAGLVIPDEFSGLLMHTCPDNEAYNLDLARARIVHGEYDLLWISADVGPLNNLLPAIREARARRSFLSLAYVLIDCDTLTKDTFACLAEVDYPVVGTEFARQVLARYWPLLQLQVVPLGCEPEVFYPLSAEERRECRRELYSIESDSTFLVLNCNRNQWRKDLGRSMSAFYHFQKKVPDSVLYLHAKQQDLGGHLPTQAYLQGLRLSGPDANVIFTPFDFGEATGVARSALNQMYNAADVLISTSTGEGWGLSTTEAMTAQLPVIVPRNSAFTEIIGEDEERGYLVRSGGTFHWMIPYGISDNPRPTVHTPALIDKLLYVAQHRADAREKALAGRAWAVEHSWATVEDIWGELFSKMEASYESEPSAYRRCGAGVSSYSLQKV